jgi:hypothetical protein
MAKSKIEVDLDINSNIEPSLKQLRELKKQLREAAAGSAEFNKISEQIRDVEDALDASKKSAEDFGGLLEQAPGPVGQIAKGMKSLELNTKSFGTALKLSGIGLLVSLVGGLVTAFTNSEKAAKKLEPVLIGFEKIMGGIFAVFEPVLDIFIEMIEYALPVFTKVVGGVYSALFGVFTYVKENAVGVGKLLKGIFTLDTDLISEGFNQFANAALTSFKSVGEAYERFGKGTEELTSKELEQLELRKKAEEEAAQKRKEAAEKALEEQRKLAEERKKIQEEADKILLESELSLLDEREREKRERQIRYDEDLAKLKLAGITDLKNFEEEFRRDIQEINDKYDKEDEDRRKAVEDKRLADLKTAQENYIKEFEAGLIKGTELIDKNQMFLNTTIIQYLTAQRELLSQSQTQLDTALSQGLITQEQYNTQLAKITEQRVKFNQIEEESYLAKFDLISGALSSFAQLVGQNTKVGKAMAIAQTTIDTYLAAQQAYRSQFLPIPETSSPIRGAIAAAAAIAGGLARVRSILQVQVPSASTPSSASQPSTQSSQPIQVVARRAQGGFVFGQGGQFTDSIPAMLSDGEFVMNSRSAALFSPLLSMMNNMGNLPNTSLPQSIGNQSLVDVIDQTISSRPIRTYVTAQDMSNQQQFDRTIKTRSLI